MMFTAQHASASMGPPLCSDGNVFDSEAVADANAMASMGPPLCSDGNLWDSYAAKLGQGGFNGAAALQRWKFVATDVPAARPFTLQWGRRFAATEMIVISFAMIETYVASMGPPLCSDGNVATNKIGLNLPEASMGPPLCSDGNFSAS